MLYIIRKQDQHGRTRAFFMRHAAANMRRLQWTDDRDECRRCSKAEADEILEHLTARREPVEKGWSLVISPA